MTMDGYTLASNLELENVVPWSRLSLASRGALAVLAYARADVPYDNRTWLYELVKNWAPLVALSCYKQTPKILFHAREVSHDVHEHKCSFISASTLAGAAHYAHNLIAPVVLPLNMDYCERAIHLPSVVTWARKSRTQALRELTDDQLLRNHNYLKRIEKEDEYLVPFRKGVVRVPRSPQNF